MNILKHLLPLVVLVFAASCSDDNNSGLPSLDGTFSTIVTYEGSTDTGSTFTVTEPGTTVLTTFTSIRKFPTEGTGALAKGERVLIYYKNTAEKRYASGAIDLRGIMKIYNGKAELKTQSEISPLRVDFIDVKTVEMAGEYVDLVATAAASSAAVFGLYIDEATADDEFPVAYVVFSSDAPSAAERTVYGSFSVADVWNRSTCRGLRVRYNTMSGQRDTTFPKSSQPIRPME